MPDLTPDDVAGREFRSGFRGYETSEVRAFLKEVAAGLAALVEDRDALTERLAQFEGKDLGAEIDSISQEVAGVLQSARTAAETIRERAAADASRWRTEAVADVEAERAAAVVDAEQLRADAWSTADQLVSQCQAHADGVIEAAEQEALRLVGEAERESHRLQAAARREAEDMVRAARMESERLAAESKARHDELIAEAMRQSEAAQERTLALEQRRQELMKELEAVRSTLIQVEGELDQRRERLGLPPTEEPPPAAAKVVTATPTPPTPAASTPRPAPAPAPAPKPAAATTRPAERDEKSGLWEPGETVRVVRPERAQTELPAAGVAPQRLEPEVKILSGRQFARLKAGLEPEEETTDPDAPEPTQPLSSASTDVDGSTVKVVKPTPPAEATPPQSPPVVDQPVVDQPVEEAPADDAPSTRDAVVEDADSVEQQPADTTASVEEQAVVGSPPISNDDEGPSPVLETGDSEPAGALREDWSGGEETAADEFEEPPVGDPEPSPDPVDMSSAWEGDPFDPEPSTTPEEGSRPDPFDEYRVWAENVPERPTVAPPHRPIDQVVPSPTYPPRLQSAPRIVSVTSSDAASSDDDQPQLFTEVAGLFDRLRTDEHPVIAPESSDLKSADPSSPDESVVERRLTPSVVDPFETRDRLLLPVGNRALRNLKRQLTEAQNEVLEEIRLDEANWHPTADAITTRVRADLVVLFAESFGAGHAAAEELLGGRAPRPTTPREEVAGDFVDDLVEELEHVLADGRHSGHGARQLGASLSRVFRGWRTDQSERRVRDLSLEAYHEGLARSLELAGVTDLVWKVAGRGCATCRAAGADRQEDLRPPAHPGCECTLAPGPDW
jgi:DivIVA domain-containing protein